MTQLTISKLKPAELRALVNYQEEDGTACTWVNPPDIQLDALEQQQVETLQTRLRRERTHLMNEATIWSRAIYPLLLLAERDPIQAWAEIELSAQYKAFSIAGIADGVLGRCIAGEMETPYLIVVEAKRGSEAENPKYPLCGQILAAAHLNWQKEGTDPGELFGCYTIADVWTFVRAQVAGFEAERPTLKLEFSQEYLEKIEAAEILRILKGIVRQLSDSAMA